MTVCDRGEGGVKNHQKKRDILYGRPLGRVELYKKFTITFPSVPPTPG